MKPYQPEEICALSRSLLRQEHLAKQALLIAKKAARRHSRAHKAAQIAALVASSGSLMTAQLVDEMCRKVNRYERFEVKAQLFYAARVSGLPLDVVRRQMKAAIGLDTLRVLTVLDYLRARDWLWETFFISATSQT